MKMKAILFAFLSFTAVLYVSAQAPDKISYQAVVRNAAGFPLMDSDITLIFIIHDGTVNGTTVDYETISTTTNHFGLVSVAIGTGAGSTLKSVNWASGNKFLQVMMDTDDGLIDFGTSQFLSVPYALYAKTTGSGKSTTITSSQTYTVPNGVSKIKVELWGGAGGGGGAEGYSYRGGDGGSGGFVAQEMDVTGGQQLYISVGDGGLAGTDVPCNGCGSATDGGNGGNTQLGTYKAAGGSGGTGGSYICGQPGTNNVGAMTAHSSIDNCGSNTLDVYPATQRSYFNPRTLTSKPGNGGIFGYKSPTAGEGGAAIITIIE